MSVRCFSNAADLLAAGDVIRSEGFQHGAEWQDLLARSCGMSERRPRYFLSDEGLFLALCQPQGSPLLPGLREFQACSSMYTTEFGAGLEGWDFAALQAASGGFDLLNMDAVSLDDAALNRLRSEAAAQGFGLQLYQGFENWFEPVVGDDFDSYWARRPGKLRNTAQRKGRKAGREFNLEFAFTKDANDPVFLAEYQDIHSRSWKEPEPHPDFIPEFVKAAAAAGALRMGVLRFDDRPVAAQIWLVSAGRATIFKLAYDDAYKAYSPGTLLSIDLTKRVLAEDQPAEIDFGRGPDLYKRDWLGQLRHRHRVLLFAPTPGGRMAMGYFRMRDRIKKLLGKG